MSHDTTSDLPPVSRSADDMNVDPLSAHLAATYGADHVSAEACECLVVSVKALGRDTEAMRYLTQVLAATVVLIERTKPDGDVTPLLNALDMVREVIGIDAAEVAKVRAQIHREGGSGLAIQ